MKPIFKIRPSRPSFRIEPPSSVLPQKKVLDPAPESLPTTIIFHFHHPHQPTLLFSHRTPRGITYPIPAIDAIENP